MKTIGEMVAEWNENLPSHVARVESWNAELIQQFRDGQLSADAVIEGLEEPPEPLKPPSLMWCHHWRERYGWSMVTRGQDDAAWLSFDHPDMQASRDAVQHLIQHEKVNENLILNYDQLWRTCWATSRYKLAFKDRRLIGKQSKNRKARVGPREDKKLTSVKGARRSLTVSHLNGSVSMCIQIKPH